jgi:hypothetical protein
VYLPGDIRARLVALGSPNLSRCKFFEPKSFSDDAASYWVSFRFFLIPISQPVAISASRTQNPKMLKKRFYNFRKYKNLMFKGNTNFLRNLL